MKWDYNVYAVNEVFFIGHDLCEAALGYYYSDVTWASLHLKPLAAQLFVQKLVWVNTKDNVKAPHSWLFVRGIHRWPVDSPHKGPAMWKVFPCHFIFMQSLPGVPLVQLLPHQGGCPWSELVAGFDYWSHQRYSYLQDIAVLDSRIMALISVDIRVELLTQSTSPWTCFLSLARSELRLCSANHRPGYWSNLPCGWPSTAWAYSEQETENQPWSLHHLTPPVL